MYLSLACFLPNFTTSHFSSNHAAPICPLQEPVTLSTALALTVLSSDDIHVALCYMLYGNHIEYTPRIRRDI